ncbi:hypothetical protein [Flavobacterium sp. SLB02]|uniref:hypothetical protein n=1 Tax=Flavobacterium sp. SLB02 TaxID=2665645 RepID=UPI0012A9AED1|nr:hypothetical protein [Flavobacterium sp. SLB02]QGK75268.1 hypothetical protein GIY83_14640 [Flavobacterium sp. SLB02]
MKKILLCMLLATFNLSAQTVLLDEKIDKENSPGFFQYLPISKKIVFCITSKSTGNSAFTLDKNGKKTFLYENNTRRYCNFSRTEKSYVTSDPKDESWTPDYNLIIDGQQQLITKEKFKDINFKYFGSYNRNNVYDASASVNDFEGSFNDLYILGFTNAENSWRIKSLEKEDIYLEVIEIKSNSKTRVKLEKPDFTLVKGDQFAKTDFEPTFVCRLNNNENFDLITKSLSADSQTVILYKTAYNFEGKKIKTQPFTIHLNNNYFITSSNGGGLKTDTSTQSMQSVRFINDSYALDVLSINNYYEDQENGEMYIYGLFSDQAPKQIGGKAFPKGFYVFKFDKNGNKLWESVNHIDSKDYFEKVRNSSDFQVNLSNCNKNLIFSCSINSFTEFTNAAIIDKTSGSVLKSSFIEYNNNLSHGKYKYFLSQTYDCKELKNKTFSQIGFAAVSINSKVMDYLKSIPEKGDRLYFETLYSDEGIWMVETDNKKYYKVLLFKD